MTKKQFEIDLYEPIDNYFTKLGYTVKAEVKNCDIIATKNEELLVIELKKSFNLHLLYQALERQKITNNVYIAIPRPKRHNKNMLAICSKLGVGLIFVSLDTKLKRVEIILNSLNINTKLNYKKRNIILKEINDRKFNLNIGGSKGVKLNTAFREKNIKIACIIKILGALSGSQLIKNYECEKDTYNILYNNYYGWFYRVKRGMYDLTPKCILELQEENFKEIVDFYNNHYKLYITKVL